MTTTTNFTQAMQTHNAQTYNGALSHATPDASGKAPGRLALFFKGVRGLEPVHLYQHLRVSAQEDIQDAFLLAFHLRDCRGGKGERELGRRALQWLFVNYSEGFMRILPFIEEYGRWDDLLHFFPRVLNLEDATRLRGNFHSNVTDDQIMTLRVRQQEIVKFVTDRLIEDSVKMLESKPCSLLAKWLPTEKDSMDREFGLINTICSSMNISPRSYRKNYVSPLRAYINVVERKMCEGNWKEIDFSKVPSCAMRRLKNTFKKHEPKRYNEWVKSLVSGESRVKATQLFPHELVREVLRGRADNVTEEQWKVLERQVNEMGSLAKTLVIADVSGSMTIDLKGCQPIEVSVALAIMTANAVKGPFHNHVITFSSTPKFEVLRNGSLVDRVQQVNGMHWEMTTDFCAVHRLILDQALLHGVCCEDMPESLIVVSDMQFDKAAGNVTNFEEIREMYETAGYLMPKLVFWNVNGETQDFPVCNNEQGVALISGFSPSILKSLMDLGEVDPYTVMRATLNSERYIPICNALSS